MNREMVGKDTREEVLGVEALGKVDEVEEERSAVVMIEFSGT